MNYLKKYFISPQSSIRKAISLIDENKSQIGLVGENFTIEGLVTDGDIRRGLIRGISLDSPISSIMQRNFKFLPENATKNQALELMRINHLRHLPIINSKNKIIELLFLDELTKPKTLNNKVLIMAGGRGLRLGNLTRNCPKPMLKIHGKPILEIIIEQLIESGFKHFYISVNYLKNQIIDYFKDVSDLNIKIDYLEEELPLGTAGSLSLIKENLDLPLLVINGDILTKVDYNLFIDYFRKNNPTIVVGVRKFISTIPFGIIKMDGINIDSIVEKPEIVNFINAGIYLIDPKIIKYIPKNHYFDMPDLIKISKKKNSKIIAFPIHEYWQDIGIPETLKIAEQEKW